MVIDMWMHCKNWTCEECIFVLPFHVEFESFAHKFVATKTGVQLGAEVVTMVVLPSVNKLIHNTTDLFNCTDCTVQVVRSVKHVKILF